VSSPRRVRANNGEDGYATAMAELEEILDELEEGAHDLLALGVPEEGADRPVQDDVTRHLQARQVDPTLIEQVAALLHLCDSARYAPGALAIAQLTGIVEDAAGLVQQLEASGRL